ncbi:MAG: hypothetical protein R6X08_08370 [Desulfosalsimonadaceae bacterium]
MASDADYVPGAGDFFQKLAKLYEDMDRQYEDTAAAYGFHCRGCRDNCCRTRFFHHTHIEAAYLLHGFSRLDAVSREAALQRAREVRDAQEEGGPGSEQLMCPLNFGGWCILYPYRPMICRLHGLAHELRVPGKPTTYGPGCMEFERIRGDLAYIPFDRTPFYIRMASLEQEFKTFMGQPDRIRKTVAQIIADAADTTQTEASRAQ